MKCPCFDGNHTIYFVSKEAIPKVYELNVNDLRWLNRPTSMEKFEYNALNTYFKFNLSFFLSQKPLMQHYNYEIEILTWKALKLIASFWHIKSYRENEYNFLSKFYEFTPIINSGTEI